MDEELYNTLSTLFPDVDVSQHQDIIYDLIDLEGIINNINTITESFFLESEYIILEQDNNGVSKVSRSYATDVLYEVQLALYDISHAGTYYEMMYIIAYMFSFLDLMSMTGAILGYSQEIIYTEWKTFIISLSDKIEKLHNIGDIVSFDNMSELVHVPLFNKAYEKGSQIRNYLTQLIGGDISNLSDLKTDLKELEEKHDFEFTYLQTRIQIVYNALEDMIFRIRKNDLPSIQDRLTELENRVIDTNTNIEESVNNNTETINNINELLVAPVTSFYNYKETNNELYLQELQVFAQIFQDVLDLGYISIQPEIENKLEIIIRGVE